MLIGRSGEQAAIDALLVEGRDVRSASLVIIGEAGIGKSALLQYVRERADGFELVEARGVESEADLPYSALSQLLRPLLSKLAAIPGSQADALRGALALSRTTTPVGRFAVSAATVSLLSEAAVERPLLCLVDDAHWLDDSSADALQFTMRRLGAAERVVLIFAARVGEQRVFGGTEIDELRLGPLDEASAIELVKQAGVELSARMTSQVVTAAGGNPLALLELPAAMSHLKLGDPFSRMPVGERVRRTFASRIRSLPPKTKTALLVAAASTTGRLDVVLPGVVQLGGGAEHFHPAEAAGLVTLDDGRVSFRHPLVRSVVYEDAPPSARRAAHGALAVSDAPEMVEERIWHRAAAAMGPDDGLAVDLEGLGLGALNRGAPAEASFALERSARATIGDDQRARRMLAAASAAWSAGMPDHARSLIDEGSAAATDRLLRTDLRHLLGRITTWTGRPMDGHAILLNEAEEISGLDAYREALLIAESAIGCLMAGEIRQSLATSARALELAFGIGGPAESMAVSVRGEALLLAGLGEEALPLLQQAAAAGSTNPLLFIVFQGLRCLEQFDSALDVLPRLVAAARTHTDLPVLPYALAALAETESWTGRLVPALAHAAESYELARDTDQEGGASFSLVTLARVEALMGREEECRLHVAEAQRLGTRCEIGSIAGLAAAALGSLEFVSGSMDRVVQVLEPVAEMTSRQGLGEPAAVPWAPDLIEAYIQLGRTSDAERALDRFGREAKATGRTWALAVDGRCRGLLASDDEFEEIFGDALEWHDRTPTPFERARTALCLGERLRRARRRFEARRHLTGALRTFETCGAVVWAERAAAELSATGERSRRRSDPPSRELTPQELQVAIIVVEGATNREAAAALFVSIRTIEFHLRNIYIKLGIRSRTELAHRFAVEMPRVGETE